MNQECFVIQPISDTKFTKRYDDIYKPAIEATGLNAYRVDLDPTVCHSVDLFYIFAYNLIDMKCKKPVGGIKIAHI